MVSGKLAGIVIGSIIGAILFLILALFLYKRHKRKIAAQNITEPKDEEGVIGHLEKEVEAAPVASGEIAYASQPASQHSKGTFVQGQKVVELGADGVVTGK